MTQQKILTLIDELKEYVTEKHTPGGHGHNQQSHAGTRGGVSTSDSVFLSKIEKKYDKKYAGHVKRWMRVIPDAVESKEHKTLAKDYVKFVAEEGHVTPMSSDVLNAYGKDWSTNKEELTSFGAKLFNSETYRARY